jgi:hypothetical protein
MAYHSPTDQDFCFPAFGTTEWLENPFKEEIRIKTGSEICVHKGCTVR